MPYTEGEIEYMCVDDIHNSFIEYTIEAGIPIGDYLDHRSIALFIRWLMSFKQITN